MCITNRSGIPASTMLRNGRAAEAADREVGELHALEPHGPDCMKVADALLAAVRGHAWAHKNVEDTSSLPEEIDLVGKELQTQWSPCSSHLDPPALASLTAG